MLLGGCPERVDVGRHGWIRLEIADGPRRPPGKSKQRGELPCRVVDVGVGIHRLDTHALCLGFNASDIVVAALASLRASAHDVLDALQIREAVLDYRELLLLESNVRTPDAPAGGGRRAFPRHDPVQR
jgi:hypothetical protein